jgi:hypothetical protein
VKIRLRRSCGHSEVAQFFGTLALKKSIRHEEAIACAGCQKRELALRQKQRSAQKTPLR